MSDNDKLNALMDRVKANNERMYATAGDPAEVVQRLFLETQDQKMAMMLALKDITDGRYQNAEDRLRIQTGCKK